MERCKLIIISILFGALFNIPQSSLALPMSTSDLWDISNGAVINETSGPLYYSAGYRSYVENMFGSSGGIAGSYTLFKDYLLPGYQGGSVPAGYIHFVNWSTPSAVTLRSFNLVAYNEGMDRRAFDHFELYADIIGDGSWQSIFARDFMATPGNPYGYGGSPTYNSDSNWLELAVDLVSPVVAQAFRAEFRQASWTDSRAIGPRVGELDGYDTFLDGSTSTDRQPIPEPATMLLLGTGLVGVAGAARRRKKKQA